jgi:hypothetical protein
MVRRSAVELATSLRSEQCDACLRYVSTLRPLSSVTQCESPKPLPQYGDRTRLFRLLAVLFEASINLTLLWFTALYLHCDRNFLYGHERHLLKESNTSGNEGKAEDLAYVRYDAPLAEMPIGVVNLCFSISPPCARRVFEVERAGSTCRYFT